MKVVFVIFTFILSFSGCSDFLDSSAGKLGEKCFGNGTCRSDLICVDNVCTKPETDPDEDNMKSDNETDDNSEVIDNIIETDDEQPGGQSDEVLANPEPIMQYVSDKMEKIQ